MKRSTQMWLLIVFTAAISLNACRPSDRSEGSASTSQEITLEVLDAPVSVGPAVVEVRLRSAGEATTGAQVSIRAEMTHAGMGAPLIVDATEVEAGVYRSEDFELEMAGDWFLTAVVVYPDGTTGEANQPIQVGR